MFRSMLLTRCYAASWNDVEVLVFAEYLVAWITHDFQIIIELVSFWYVFFLCIFGCPTANFGPLSRKQPHSPDVNHLHFTYSTWRLPGARNEVGSLSLTERLVGFEPGAFQFWSQRFNRLDQSPQMKERRSANDIFYTRVASFGLFFIFHWTHLFIDWKNPFYLHHLVDLYSIWWIISALNIG